MFQYSYEHFNHIPVCSLTGVQPHQHLGFNAGHALPLSYRHTRLINARLTSASRRLDDLDAALASCSLPDWTGTAAELYRARLDELRKQSLALRDALNDTSRILWSVGAA